MGTRETEKVTPKRALEIAIDLVGGQVELAAKLRKCGVKELKTCRQQTVSYWLQRGFVAPHAALPIEAIVEGKVTRTQLCPVLYPAEAVA